MLEEILLVNEKTGEYDSIGLYACFRCNVTPKNVKTNKIFGSFCHPRLILLSIHMLLSSQSFQNAFFFANFFGTLMK